jgi:universal stress protein A
MLSLQTIVFPTDYSPFAQHACHYACALARDYKAKLLLLHVVEPPVMVYDSMPAEDLTTADDRARLDQYAAELRAAYPGLTIEPVLRVGLAAEEIVRLASQHPCDLIVMGTHGRTGLARILLGSVTEEVMRHAQCPLVTVRTAAPEPTEANPAAAANP